MKQVLVAQEVVEPLLRAVGRGRLRAGEEVAVRKKPGRDRGVVEDDEQGAPPVVREVE